MSQVWVDAKGVTTLDRSSTASYLACGPGTACVCGRLVLLSFAEDVRVQCVEVMERESSRNSQSRNDEASEEHLSDPNSLL